MKGEGYWTTKVIPGPSITVGDPPKILKGRRAMREELAKGHRWLEKTPAASRSDARALVASMNRAERLKFKASTAQGKAIAGLKLHTLAFAKNDLTPKEYRVLKNQLKARRR